MNLIDKMLTEDWEMRFQYLHADSDRRTSTTKFAGAFRKIVLTGT